MNNYRAFVSYTSPSTNVTSTHSFTVTAENLVVAAEAATTVAAETNHILTKIQIIEPKVKAVEEVATA